MVFFYCKTGGSDCGIFGWGVIDRIEKYQANEDVRDSELEDRFYFTPSAPTNYLKMDPWKDSEMENATDTIRGKITTATMFFIPETPEDLIRKIQKGINTWLNSR